MKSTKCTSCGANIEIDSTKKNFKCPYCGTNFINDENDDNKLNEEKIIEAISTSLGGKVDDEYLDYVKGPRPKLNLIFAIVLMCFYFVPAVIYIAIVCSRQHIWDEYHNKKK